MSVPKQLKDLADLWLSQDKNPETRKEIVSLLENQNVGELQKRLGSRIEFGTAGLRARMEAGFSRMNDLTVIQATQGLVSYLLSSNASPSRLSVVIGHDHRYNSERFAKLTAGVFLAKGIKVYFFEELVHTPLVPYAVTLYSASCGVMITASHNPKDDNGYKLYWNNGCQIIPPVDTHIADAILKNLEPQVWDESLVAKEMKKENGLCINPYNHAVTEYFNALKDLKTIVRSKDKKAKVKFAYTAMHGVGAKYAKKAFEAFDLDPFAPVEEQIQSDPSFPTVKFPNPEEPGALNLAISAADRANANVIFANDPDADRLAVAEKQTNGKWHVFSGNEIGLLLASYLLLGYRQRFPSADLAVLTTAVSSRLLSQFAETEKLSYVETLTGFKWLGNKSIELESNPANPKKVYFAYEEAIGFMCGSLVKDKDGVSALACFAEMTCWIYDQGKTVMEWLMECYVKYGCSGVNNSYVIVNEKEKMKAMFDRIRYGKADTSKAENLTPSYPSQLSNYPILSVRDLTIGYDSTNPPSCTPSLPVSSSSEMITFYVKLQSAVVTLRTSGTEPKVKWYAELPGLWNGLDDDKVTGADKVNKVKQVAERELNKLVGVIKKEWLTLDA
ncbi:hypothetical protein BKA69DRAFT_1157814 [Paraphysoderma sedebokerense]|nr:hypothetical protein BKA69DRAFT_1157814 [Paraphysoderma sedebokerense]